MTTLAAHNPCVVAIASLPALSFLLRRITGADEAALSAGVMIPQTDRPDLLLPLVWADDQPARRSD